MPGEEGAFLACTLWLADALVLAGDLAKAQALFDRVAALANDVGLLAEEYDSVARRQTGNFPQALTHIAQAYRLKEAYDRGIDAAQKAIKLAPGKARPGCCPKETQNYRRDSQAAQSGYVNCVSQSWSA